MDETTYTDQHSNWDPMPNMGPHKVAELTGAAVNVGFDASASFCPGSSISAYAWSCATASAVAGDTTATCTFQFDATGWHIVYLTLTAANAKSFFGVRYVYIWSQDDPPALCELPTPGHCDADSGGWRAEIRMYDADLEDIYDRAMVIVFSQDYYGDTQSDIGRTRDGPQPGVWLLSSRQIPPYPFESDDPEDQAEIYEATRGYYVAGVEKNAWGKTVFPLDCHAKPGGIWTSGFDGIIAEVAGAGVSVDEAYRNAEATFYAMSLSNKQARLKDIVRTTERRLSELAAMKYDVPSAFPVILSTEPIAPVVPHEPQKVKTNENKTVPVPAHMARTTVSMPTKLG